MEKAWNSSWSKAYNIICETWWSNVIAWACMAFSGTGLLVFSDDVTEDRSSQKNSELYRDTLSAQIQLNAANAVYWTALQMDDVPKHKAKATQWKKVEYSAMIESILLKLKLKDTMTHKQTITEAICSKGLAKHHKRGNPWASFIKCVYVQIWS